MTAAVILTGFDAIRYARQHRLTLSKYADPTEEAKTGLTVAEARQIASEDPSLIYIERGPMRKFLVNTNCEYSVEVEAESEEHACDLAEQIPYSEWGQAWAMYMAEPADEDDTPPPPGVIRNK